MKLHNSLVKAVAQTLEAIFMRGEYADKAVAYRLKRDARWGARDRHFIAETTYQMVRWWRLITETYGEKQDNTLNYYYKLFAVWEIIQGYTLPPWKEFEGLDSEKIIAKARELSKIRKYRESIPDWLDELGSAELGDELWTKELAELNEMAKLVIRVNTLKTSVDVCQRLFEEKGIETSKVVDCSNALVFTKRFAITNYDEFKNGLFEVQDASSQLVAPFMELEEGMTVIDACAGAGGKSLHIAAILKNKGRIISMDVDEKKLNAIGERAYRAGVTNIEQRVVSPFEIHSLKNSADRLLLDVPCSGLGVLRRKPYDKWKLSMEYIDSKRIVQQQILSEYSSMLKPGGILVYATCSILPSENQLQIQTFLNKNKGQFEFIEDRKVLPSEGFDGFYMARIKKKNSE